MNKCLVPDSEIFAIKNKDHIYNDTCYVTESFNNKWKKFVATHKNEVAEIYFSPLPKNWAIFLKFNSVCMKIGLHSGYNYAKYKNIYCFAHAKEELIIVNCSIIEIDLDCKLSDNPVIWNKKVVSEAIFKKILDTFRRVSEGLFYQTCNINCWDIIEKIFNEPPSLSMYIFISMALILFGIIYKYYH